MWSILCRNKQVKETVHPLIKSFPLVMMTLLLSCHEKETNTTGIEVKQVPDSHVLWYNQPASYFEESLVLGNGKAGASVFGGIKTDTIYLNDATLWAGEPVSTSKEIDAFQYIPQIREALEKENYALADKLNKNIQGKYSESYAPLGTMLLDFNHKDKATNYYRELDISTGISRTTYNIDGIHFSREYFVSYPDQVMVIKLKADKEQALDFHLSFQSLLHYTTSAENIRLKVEGYAPYHAEPNYRGDIADAILFDKDRGTRFSTYFDIKTVDGTVRSDNKTLHVEHASEAVVSVSIATSFNGFDKDPAKDGLDNQKIALDRLTKAIQKEYTTLKSTHTEEVQHYMSRVAVDFGESNAPSLPTDQRLKRYYGGEEDKNLEILYMQYGRYLLLSSSRTKGVPANLQGIWNPYMRPPWSSNYTMNINAEENYWLAETANLSEMHHPFLDFVGNLAANGKQTAQSFYGVNKGWASCHNSDIWALTNPVGDYGEGHPVWACWNMSGPWAVTHLWEHYQFTKDKEFLNSYAYPLMKGAAEFCLEWLTKDKYGELVTAPSTSPENMFITDEGYKGATLYGGTADLAMIRECFQDVVKASQVLGTDEALRKQLSNALNQLHPYQIGKKGQLQEWYHDWEDVDPQHRHQSHLFGLHPGSHITPEKTPRLAEACRRSLEIKGDESTGWSKGWRINLWARLQDGNHAYKMYRELLSYVDPSGIDKGFSTEGGTYPNLFDAHPPFQIDGNFGGSAGVIEMLLQSHQNNIHLLPALPDAWPQGKAKGLCARGGFEIDMQWHDKQLEKVSISSKTGGKTTLYYQGKSRNIELHAEESLMIDWES